MPEPAIDVQGVTHRYAGNRVALQDLSLQVTEGELFALLGPNGSGKTTLFRLLATLMPPTEGTVQVFGHRTHAAPHHAAPHAVRRLLGVVFQTPALDEALTVEENLRLHGAFFGLRGRRCGERITTLLRRFEVADRRTDRVETLSGGLQRRVDLTRGLLHRPRLLLLDEPTAGLDPAARRVFWRYLEHVRDRDGTTLLVATHLMDEADRASRLAILNEGECVACGVPKALTNALGKRTLWIESNAPEALQQRIQAQFGLDVRRTGSALQIDDDDAPALLSRLYDAFAPQIESATVRRPTLEDVFMARTGRRPAVSDETSFANA